MIYKYIALSTAYCFTRKMYIMNNLENIKVINENNRIQNVPIKFEDKLETSLMSMVFGPLLFPFNLCSDIEHIYYNKNYEYQKVRLITDYIFK
jgi:hypothetical protein